MYIKLKCLVCLVLLLALSGAARATDYYVSPSGNDANLGTSPATAWQTISKVNTKNLSPGDRVMFEAGQTFSGTITLNAPDSGTSGNEVEITSYGTGRATINGVNGKALSASGCDYLIIENLNFVGSGRLTGNTQNGVEISNGEHVEVNDIDVSGFQKSGLHATASDHVRFTNVYAHDNGFAGITSGWSGLSTDLYIGYCVAENNPGDPTNLTNHSGNGILVGAVENCTIEFCEAMENGWDMPRTGNGPVGIWAYNANDVTIQFCIAHHNKSPGSDGGGFDFDGGVTNSIIQYNYSHDNEGPGCGLFQYSGAAPWYDNIIRYNITQNDGITTGKVGIAVWAADGETDMNDADIYNNTVYNDMSGGHAVTFWSGVWSGMRFRNNIFITDGSQISGGASKGIFQGNLYWSTSGTGFSVDGYTNLTDWSNATGQEKVSGIIVGIYGDPQLISPATATLTDPTLIATLAEYRIQPGSSAIDNALDLLAEFGLDPGDRDFYGHAIPKGSDYDMGIHEYDPCDPPVALNDNYSVVADNTLGVDGNSGVLANDITYGGALSAVLVSQATNGSLTFDSNGAFVYEPNTGFMGTDVFTYHANDGTYDSNIAAVFIDALDAHPIAYDDSYGVIQNTILIVNANSGVLANDFSPSGSPMSASLVSGPNNGSLTLYSDGSFRYDPNNSFAGTDSFTYYASAGGYDSNTAAVYISVREPVTVVNPSFELDGSGKYITCHTGEVGIGWTSVNTWVGVDIYCGAPGACVDCRSPVPPDGNCYSYMQTNNTYLYQALEDKIIEGGQYTFTFDAQTGNSGADIVPSQFYVNDSNSHVQIASSTIPLSTGAWNNDLSVSFTAAAGQPYLGKKLGIQLHAPVPGDMDTNKWIFLDNVRLDLDFAADFNGDDDINFLDYALLADAWMTAPGHPQYNDIYDLHDNDIIDMLDLDIFVEKWLWQTEP